MRGSLAGVDGGAVSFTGSVDKRPGRVDNHAKNMDSSHQNVSYQESGSLTSDPAYLAANDALMMVVDAYLFKRYVQGSCNCFAMIMSSAAGNLVLSILGSMPMSSELNGWVLGLIKAGKG